MNSPRRQRQNQPQSQRKAEHVGPVLNPQDRARLVLNTPDLANRSVPFGKGTIPVIHLGIGPLERFRAACVPIEDLYKKMCEVDIPVPQFLKLYKEECLQILTVSVPRAAAVAMGCSEKDIRRYCRPLDTLCVILSQWLHNQEIGKLQELFPHPESDDEETDDPNLGNPLSIVERMASVYPWSFDELLSRTVPQIYLMGVSSAWAYEKAKASSDTPNRPGKPKTNRMPIEVDGQKHPNFKKMTADQYREYLNKVMGAAPVDQTGAPAAIIGTV